MIGPLEIVHDPHRRHRCAQFVDESQQLLRERGRHILAPPGGDLAPQQRDDGFLPRVVRWLADPQSVQDGQQWQRLAEFIAGAPIHLASQSGSLRTGRPDQSGFADAGLALDEHGLAVSRGRLGGAADKPRQFKIPADQLIS